MAMLYAAIPFNPLVFTVLVLALLALLAWVAVKIVKLYRDCGEPGWQRDEADSDGRSLYDRVTSFLNYPWS